MNTIEARVGLTWIKDGFFLFRKRPFLLTNFFIAYFFFILIVGSFPHIGSILPPLVTPFFSIFFLQAINHVKEDKGIVMSELLSVFNKTVFIRLFILGLLYLLAAVIAIYLSSWIDGGIFMRAMGGEKFEAQVLVESNFKSAFTVAALINFVAQLLFWFVTPLIGWRNMPVIQSLFYSFFTILRTWRAFIIYLIGLFLFCCLIPMLINTLIAIALGQSISMFFTFAMLMILAVFVYCSFYSMYIYIYGKPNSVRKPSI